MSKNPNAGEVIGHQYLFYALVGLASVLLLVQSSAVVGNLINAITDEPGLHFFHYTILRTLGLVGLAGALTQWRRPKQNVGGIQLMLISLGALNVAIFLGGPIEPVYFLSLVLVIAIAAVHPTREKIVRPTGRINLWLLGMVVAAAIPLLGFTAAQLMLQQTMQDAHAALSHYEYMAGVALTVIGGGMVAGLKPLGWRIPVYGTSGLMIVYGGLSLFYPAQASTTGPVWAGLAILWGALFASLAELSASDNSPTVLRDHEATPAVEGH